MTHVAGISTLSDMKKTQNKAILLGRLPIANEVIPMQVNGRKKAVNVSEAWSTEVGSFLLDLYPNALEDGATLAELQIKSVFEAYSNSGPSLEDFMSMIAKMGGEAKVINGDEDEDDDDDDLVE